MKYCPRQVLLKLHLQLDENRFHSVNGSAAIHFQENKLFILFVHCIVHPATGEGV